MTLADLKTGEKGVIVKVRGRGAFRKRIIEMGFVVGKQVIVIRNAPLKDPIEYNIMGYEVSLRRSEAALIEVVKDLKELGDQEINHYEGTLELESSLNLIKPIRSRNINVALVGNPNSGKTTLFNYASHSKEKTGNYGGVTIDAKEAKFKYKGYTFYLVDLPGTYSITSYTPEELFVRDHIINQLPDIILNVVDTSNLERNLYLTTQLVDMDMKVVMALNMWDEFRASGDGFDYESLAKMIGIPMVPTVSSTGEGIPELFDKLIAVYEDNEPTVRHIHINYGKRIELSIQSLQELIRKPGNEALTAKVSPRYLALKLLEGDVQEVKRVKAYCVNAREILQLAQEEKKRIETLRNETMETVITDAKYGFIEGALKETYKKADNRENKITRSRIIDAVVTNKVLSYPIFLFAMWLTFQATFYLGDYPMQWIEWLFNEAGGLLNRLMPDNAFRHLLVDGVIGGVGGVIVFLPNILILFFFITLMEATGYMARVAFIVDKLMHKIGLHGKSFIPMLMGFGCNVPAIMATRTIESRTDRLVTMLIIPFMSCSARYPVYVLIISAFFPSYRGSILFGIYLFGILLAGIIAWAFKKTLFKVETIPFVMELPPYRKPKFTSVLKQTWFKGEQYLKKMGTVILLASIIIWVLGFFPMGKKYEVALEQNIKKTEALYQKKIKSNASNPEIIKKLEEEKNEKIRAFENKTALLKQKNSFIGRIGKFIEPVIKPLGFEWRMGVSLVAGSAAKEVVVSTMGVLFPNKSGENLSLPERLRNSVYLSGPKAGQPVFTPLIALSFMIFILIYFPCIAVVAAIKNETGQWKWSLFLAIYTTTLAYVMSLIIYQLGTLLGF